MNTVSDAECFVKRTVAEAWAYVCPVAVSPEVKAFCMDRMAEKADRIISALTFIDQERVLCQ